LISEFEEQPSAGLTWRITPNEEHTTGGEEETVSEKHTEQKWAYIQFFKLVSVLVNKCQLSRIWNTGIRNPQRAKLSKMGSHWKTSRRSSFSQMAMKFLRTVKLSV
jgi:hypothetical protein